MNQRIGGDIVLETLAQLGASHVVGLPGQHALGLFDALRRSDMHYLSSRIENNAGFMADGLARQSGTVAPLFLSTGPGALTSLAALQEAAASSIPVLAVSAQIPVHGVGGGRHGYLHELPDQSASFRGVVKHTFTVRQLAQVGPAIAQAWQLALDAPAGPVLVEIPQDILLEHVGEDVLPVPDLAAPTPRTPPLDHAAVARAAEMLAGAKNPVIYAGGGVLASGAEAELLELAELLAIPVGTTIGGKGVFPWEHPLSLQSWIEDRAFTELQEHADVFLAIGTGLGELSSNYFTLAPKGQFIHIEADLGRVTSNHPGLGMHADAAEALGAIIAALKSKGITARDASGAHAIAQALRETVADRLAGQPIDKELRLMRELREQVPTETHTFWDMTILGYWAWSAWNPMRGQFASAQGAGGLGYGLPAAIGAAFASGPESPSVLAVSGDGGALYGISELATLAQHQLGVTWLIVDDGGYGILREYMEAEFGAATATELARPDYVLLAESFGITAERVPIEEVPAAVARALAAGGPRVIVLEDKLELFAPTHL